MPAPLTRLYPGRVGTNYPANAPAAPPAPPVPLTRLYPGRVGTNYPANAPAAPATLTAGAARVVSSTATTASLAASDASGGTAPYAYQWQRRDVTAAGAWADVAAATALTLSDSGLTAGHAYGYRLKYTDAASATVTGNEVVVNGNQRPRPLVRQRARVGR